MNWEWALFLFAVVLALVPLAKTRSLDFKVRVVLVIALLSTLFGASAWATRRGQIQMADLAYQKIVPTEDRRGDYVSSEACRSCHPNEYASWHRSYHRTMTQYATPDAVKAPFAGVTLEARGERYDLKRRGDEYWVTMPDPDWKGEQAARLRLTDFSSLTNAPRVERRVTMVTGSHALQKFWVSSGKYGNLQWDLPFTYLLDDRRWVLREDSIVIDPEKPMLVQIWNGNCVKCHTTAPLPRRNARTRASMTKVAELGISCEACHGPAVEHIEAHRKPLQRFFSHFSDSSDTTIHNPADMSAAKSSQVCAQCHAMKLSIDSHWIQSGFRFRPGDDLSKDWILVRPNHKTGIASIDAAIANDEVTQHWFWGDGEIRISGREYNGLVESGCHQRGDLSCLSCHEMHHDNPNPANLERWADDQLAQRMRTNEACLRCHEDFRENIAAHTHHAVGSSGSECYNCHMPHTNWGIMKAIRSHTITNPSVVSSLEHQKPNACNLCHLDRSLAWTSKWLNEWYDIPEVEIPEQERTISAALLWGLRGNAGLRTLMSWHMGWEPAKAASGGEQWLVPFLAEFLTDSYSVVRHRADVSLRSITGFEGIEYDYVDPEADRVRARDRVLQQWTATAATQNDLHGDRVMIDERGVVDRGAVNALLEEQDQRSMFLIE